MFQSLEDLVLHYLCLFIELVVSFYLHLILIGHSRLRYVERLSVDRAIEFMDCWFFHHLQTWRQRDRALSKHYSLNLWLSMVWNARQTHQTVPHDDCNRSKTHIHVCIFQYSLRSWNIPKGIGCTFQFCDFCSNNSFSTFFFVAKIFFHFFFAQFSSGFVFDFWFSIFCHLNLNLKF